MHFIPSIVLSTSFCLGYHVRFFTKFMMKYLHKIKTKLKICQKIIEIDDHDLQQVLKIYNHSTNLISFLVCSSTVVFDLKTKFLTCSFVGLKSVSSSSTFLSSAVAVICFVVDPICIRKKCKKQNFD